MPKINKKSEHWIMSQAAPNHFTTHRAVGWMVILGTQRSQMVFGTESGSQKLRPMSDIYGFFAHAESHNKTRSSSRYIYIYNPHQKRQVVIVSSMFDTPKTKIWLHADQFIFHSSWIERYRTGHALGLFEMVYHGLHLVSNKVRHLIVCLKVFSKKPVFFW